MGTILSALYSVYEIISGIVSALTSWTIFRRGEKAQQAVDTTAALAATERQETALATDAAMTKTDIEGRLDKGTF